MATLTSLAELADGAIAVERRVVVTDADRETVRQLEMLPHEKDENATESRRVLGLVLAYKGGREVVPVLSSERRHFERFFYVQKMRELVDRVEGRRLRIGVVSSPGHSIEAPHLVPESEGKRQPTFAGIVAESLPVYRLENITPESIGPHLDGLVLMQRERDWTAGELERVDNYVMGGGAVVVVAGAANVAVGDPTFRTTLDRRGIEPLLAAYGVGMQRDVLRDPATEVRVPVQSSTGQVAHLSVPGQLAVQDIEPFAGMPAAVELATPFVSSLALNPRRQPRARMRVVLSTSDQAVSLRDDSVDLSLATSEVPAGPAERRAIGVVVEGIHRPAFAANAALSGGGGRLVVISSPLLLANPFARAALGVRQEHAAAESVAVPYARQFLTSTILAFKGLLDWMVAGADQLACVDP